MTLIVTLKKKTMRVIIPQTDEAVNISSKDYIFGDSAEVIANHKQAFMERAYPLGKEHSYTKSQSISAAIPTCRTKSELDYIAFVVRNWQVGVKVRDMEIGYEKANLIQFRRDHKKGNKYIHQYIIEEVCAPGATEPRTVVKRMVKNEKGDMVPGGVVVSRETIFEAIDEWHRGNDHLGMERTWTIVKTKYWNISQEHVKMYLKTCLTCMKKNPVSRNEKGSRKPIVSKSFRDRFQLDLIDFRKLRKRDPFGV